MSLRSCRVVITDLEGVKHTAHVTASSLYEAMALGLTTIRGSEWAGKIVEGLNTIEVVVASVPVTHSVTMRQFQTWLARPGRTPREMSHRQHVRSLLGMADKPGR